MICSTAKEAFKMQFTEAEKIEADLARHQIEWALWDLHGKQDGPPEWLIDKDDELVRPFEQLALSIYQSTICYLDASSLHAYLEHFYIVFGKKFDKEKAASEYDIDHYWSGEPKNVFLNRIRQFVRPLRLLDDSDRYLKLSGVQYLETVLSNTASIIHKSKVKPTNETGVYKAVRNVLEAIFPSARTPKSNFIKNAQEYKPDILIPELSAAIEYKYAQDETKLKTCIGQIADDVKGYSGDSEYNIFYAVFYVSNDFWGAPKFKSTWAEKDFPDNWRAFYVVGK